MTFFIRRMESGPSLGTRREVSGTEGCRALLRVDAARASAQLAGRGLVLLSVSSGCSSLNDLPSLQNGTNLLTFWVVTTEG